MDLSILVVGYRTRELTLACLRSVLAQTRGLEYELLVLDNASDDGSAEAIRAAFPAAQFPQLHFEALDRNLGFAGGNLHLARRARGRYLLLLNPDTEVQGRAVQELVAFAGRHPGAGIWGGRTFFADGSLNPTYCWGRPTLWSTFCRCVGLSTLFKRVPWLNPEGIGYWNEREERAVDIVSGCFFLVERELWEQLGGFDPAFFMYGEEADLCLRAARLGKRPRVSARARIVHHGGASETVLADKQIALHAAKVRLMRKHWRRPSALLGARLLAWSTGIRAAGYGLAQGLQDGRRAEQARAWREVWRRRAEWMHPPPGAPLARSPAP